MSKTIVLTEREIEFLTTLFSQVQVSPASSEAVIIVGLVQSILQKIAASDSIIQSE